MMLNTPRSAFDRSSPEQNMKDLDEGGEVDELAGLEGLAESKS